MMVGIVSFCDNPTVCHQLRQESISDSSSFTAYWRLVDLGFGAMRPVSSRS